MLGLDSWLRTTARTEPATLPPGQKGRLVVEVTVPDGCHIEAREPGEPFLIPTALEFESVDGVTIGPVEYPPGDVERFDWSPVVLRVYRGTFELRAPIEVSVGAARGRRRVVGRVRYQGCTQTLCYPPAVQEVTASLGVVASRL